MPSEFKDVPLGLAAKIESLSSLLQRQVAMRMPRYQRPYVWEAGEVTQLMEDLLAAYERQAHSYFVGQMVFVRRNRLEVEIADGQQRLTTLTMFLAYVRDRAAAHGDMYQRLIALNDGTPRIHLRPADENFFAEYVQKPGKLSTLLTAEGTATDSQGLLCNTAKVLSSLFESMDAETLHDFAYYVSCATVLNIIEADERGGALTVFNAMNREGKIVSGPDIVKSELLERAHLSEEDAEDIAREWENLEDAMSRGAFEELIRLTPRLLYGEPVVAQGDLGAFRRVVDERLSPKEFVRATLPRYSAALTGIRTRTVAAGPHTQDVNRRIACLFNVASVEWLPLVVRYVADFGGNHDKLARFVRAMDALAFALALNIGDPNEKSKRLARIWAAGADEKLLFGADGALTLSEAERRALLGRVSGQFNRDNKTDASLRRIVCARTNAAMEGGEVPSLDDRVTTLEHILPARGGGKSWETNFPTLEQRDRYAHILGNWTFVTKRQNGRCGAKSFQEKRKIYFESPDGQMWAIMRDIQDVEDWTWEAIERRHQRLTGLLARDLNLHGGEF
ncbi:MAG: DUF262 domain-containing protein [Alphaproteobacteria bacterium]|nr:DUF262 domain-containing protein [Alphaproteobacteria bacterium]